MSTSSLLFSIILLSLLAYWYGTQRAIRLAGGLRHSKKLASLPRQYGHLTSLTSLLPALLFLLAWMSLESLVIDSLLIARLPESIQLASKVDIELYLNDVRNISASDQIQQWLTLSPEKLTGVELAALELFWLKQQAAWLKTILTGFIMLAVGLWITRRFTLKYHARERFDRIIRGLFLASSAVAVLTTLGILLSVLFESVQFFSSVSIFEFMFGTEWSPQTAMRSDQVASSGAFGAIPLFVGTLLITLIAMLFSVPVGLMIAVYLSQYASQRFRTLIKPMLEILAGVPTVVYGFFAALTVAPFIRGLGESFGLSVASESALAAGAVMGIMIIPFVSSLSDDAISAVPRALKDASLGVGATPSETIRKVLLPAALPGIVGAILLAVSRAIGETMIVVMAAGMAANLTVNPLDSVTTVTVQIVALLTGDQEFDSPKTLAAFALGLMLFVTTLLINIVALRVVRKYREQYD